MTIGLDTLEAAARDLNKQIIAHLFALANGEIDPLDRTNGLCAELSDKFGQGAMRMVRRHWSNWYTDESATFGTDMGSDSFGNPTVFYPLGREEFVFGGDMWETNRHAQRLQAITHGVVPLGNRTPIYPWERGRIRRTFCAMLAVTMQDEIGELV